MGQYLHPLAFLKELTEASAIFVALSFLGGWSYLSSYYTAFGLDAIGLDVPVPVVATIAVYVLYRAIWPMAVLAALILVRLGLGRRWRRLRVPTTSALLILLLLMTAIAGLDRGRFSAREDAFTDSDELPYVAFATKARIYGQPSCVQAETYGILECKLLLHSKGTYYFFQPIPRPGKGTIERGSLNLYMLSDSDVLSVHIQRGLNRNTGSRE